MRQTPLRRLSEMRATSAMDATEIPRGGVVEHLDLGMSMTIYVAGSEKLPPDPEPAGNTAGTCHTEH